MNTRDFIVNDIEESRDTYINAACSIWDHPELAFHEDKSSALLQDMLRDAGFSIQTGLAGMSTAFIAEYGSGSPIIGIMGEFDALPGMSQRSESVEREPLVENGPVMPAAITFWAQALRQRRSQSGTI